MKKSLTADWPLLVQHVVATTRGKQHDHINIYTWWDRPRTYQENHHAGALARCGSSSELLDVPTLASVRGASDFKCG